jgi:tryptophan-rich sensory protein
VTGPAVRRRLWIPVAVAAAGALLVAGSGLLATDIGGWYARLDKPAWQPPDWLFGPAWTVIFALAALAAAAAWVGAPHARGRRRVLVLFGINAFLNVLWSVLFFARQRPDWALMEVGFLWLSIVVMIVLLRPYSRTAAWLLVPYLAWVTFAAALNSAVVRLNAPF